MAQVNINNIIVGNNPARAIDPFSFDITFECFNILPGCFQWRIIYIGSPDNSAYDQVIDSFDMDNLAVGVMNFTVDSNPPKFQLLPQEEIVGTTALVLSVSYEKQQFFRCGYYVRNEYDENIDPPKNLQLSELKRYILSDCPRIFRFQIQWVKHEGLPTQDQGTLQQNIQLMGGDPFQTSNGALNQLQQMQYSYGMFQK